MRIRKSRIFAADFETTVFDGQSFTEVWASASVELGTEDVKIFHSIQEQFDYFVSLRDNLIVYYHNLKFDGSFWLSFFLTKLGLSQGLIKLETGEQTFCDVKELKNNSFTYSISSMGQWYRIIVKINNKIIEFRDSLKLLPFTLDRIGESFRTKHRKLEMEYKGVRFAGCEIKPNEQVYIRNDVLVLKEALEMMLESGYNRLTIGSCCLAEFKRIIGKRYDELFPDIYQVPLDEEVYGVPNAGEYCRKSYHGGWCYLAKGKENRVFRNGSTLDANSLYPSQMHSESGNFYPIGYPTFWKGDFIPDNVINQGKYYFVRIKTRFKLKRGKLPFIQLKNSFRYKPNEMLETSDVCGSDVVEDFDGSLIPTRVIMTMTMTDFKLLKDHYYLDEFEILDGCYFDSALGLFDEYIDKYKKIKMGNKGAVREQAKLFLNNLYGKLASSMASNFKIAYVKPDGSIGYMVQLANDKTPGYIPCGSAITSYARNTTIRIAQKNYHGPNKPGFIYADTDSVHCDLPADQIKGCKVHPTKFCHWKAECEWDSALFIRQKTYAEHIIVEDGEKIDNPYYSIKCAGMPQRSKDLFLLSMKSGQELTESEQKLLNNCNQEEKNFLAIKRDITDFRVGLVVPGKLLPATIKGGVVLKETTFEIR